MRCFAGLDAVFFDFDGVLVDSMAVKARAFARLYEEDAPQVVRQVTEYHAANGGMSRYKKFEHFERVLLGREPDEKRLTGLGERFASLVVEEVVASPEVEGAGALLCRLKKARIPCYVVSGTPESELRQIVLRRGLSGFFSQVRGSPTEKTQILAELMHAYCHRAECSLMVGDALGDYAAAQAVGMPFLGVVQRGELSPFPAHVPCTTSFLSALEPAA